MSKRLEIINTIYNNYDEDLRLGKSRHGQLEYVTTMEYIHRHAQPGAKILEIGAGTGRYSIALAKEGYDVTAVELVDRNIDILRKNSTDLTKLQAFQGDALNLAQFADDTFDVTLLLGPMYHLYETDDINRAIEEAIRVTKANGIILAAFLSVHAIIYCNYLNGELLTGINENFSDSYRTRHFEEQFFTGYDIAEFEQLFGSKNVVHLATAATDGVLELAEKRDDFIMSDEEFEAMVSYHLAHCENRELLGSSSHLLYVCRKAGISTAAKQLTHIGTQDIHTERLLLRRFTTEDIEPMFKNWASDDEVTKYLTWPSHSSTEITGMVIGDWLDKYSREENDYYNWAITLKERPEEPIGSIVAVMANGARIAKAEIGYCISKKHWGSGIMTESLGAVLDYMFDEVGLLRVEARHDPRNGASGKVMKKCGMVYEGTQRGCDRNNQGLCDTAVYAMIAADRVK